VRAGGCDSPRLLDSNAKYPPHPALLQGHMPEPDQPERNAIDWLDRLNLIPNRDTSGLPLTVHDAAKVFGGPLIGRSTRLRVVAGQHLGSVFLPLGDHADVEPGVEKF